jgi:hypothetical protein
MLDQLTSIDAKNFDYLPAEMLVKDLELSLFQFRDPYLLFRAEYLTALNEMNSWKARCVMRRTRNF